MVEARELTAAVDALPPDTVLTDTRMPPTLTTQAIDAANRIRTQHPYTGVEML